MNTAQDQSGAALGRRRGLPSLLWSRAVEGLAALGTLMIVLLMGMICCDVVARNAMGASLPLVSELGALTLVMIVFLQLGTTIRNDRLARADFFLMMLADSRPRAAALLNGVWSVFGMLVCAGIAWSSVGILRRDYDHAEFIGVIGGATMPTWPFRALILVGATVATLQFLLQAGGALREALSGKTAA